MKKGTGSNEKEKDFKLPDDHNLSVSLFFSIYPSKSWAFKNYHAWKKLNSNVNSLLRNFSEYKHDLNIIKKYKEVPCSVVSHIGRLLKNQPGNSEDNAIIINDYRIEQNHNVIENNTINQNCHTSSSKLANKNEQQYQQQQQQQLSYEASTSTTTSFNNKREFDQVIAEDGNDKSWESIEEHKKRKHTYSYKNGPLDSSCSTSESWTLNNVDISKMFMDYRSISIKGVKKLKDISNNRILSLSFIFFISLTQQASSTHHFSPSIHKLISDDINIKQEWTTLPLMSRIWCGKLDATISQSVNINHKQLRKLCRKFADEADGETDDEADGKNNDENENLIIVSNIINNFASKFNSWVTDCLLETTFIFQHLQPFLLHILQDENKFHGRSGESHVNDEEITLADYVLNYSTPSGPSFDLLVGEIKPPHKYPNSQLETDFIKLGKQMKVMLDRLVKSNVSDAFVAGFLVEGYKCRTFIMSLKSDGLYLLVELGKFYLLRTPSDITLIPTIIEYFLQLKSIINRTATNIEKIYQHISSPSSFLSSSTTTTTSNYISFTRISCGLPVKLGK